MLQLCSQLFAICGKKGTEATFEHALLHLSAIISVHNRQLTKKEVTIHAKPNLHFLPNTDLNKQQPIYKNIII